ncbi:MAG: DUF481 domain-containing protein [Sphingobacteriales bacterium]|nr:DUF481 domain-containing protein [Sphingobacteriales bacterium]
MKWRYLLFILCLSTYCNAQIVNVESSRMQSDTVGWLGSVGAAVSFSKNVDEIFQGNIEAHLQYKTSRNLGIWLILGNVGFLKINNTRVQSDGLLHLRYNKKVNDWLRWEFFGQFQNNVITQIDSRILLGTGPRFKLSNRNDFRLYVASLFMFEKETEFTSPKISYNDIRNSSYISFTWLPRDFLEMISTTYFQPRVNKLSDYRILNQLAFQIKATPHFSLSLKWNYLHDRFPAGTAPKTTYNFATGITYEL